jgi:hypothetical protein
MTSRYLACDPTNGIQDLPGGRIHSSRHWIIEHCVGPLGIGALILKPLRHCLHVADLTTEEAADGGPGWLGSSPRRRNRGQQRLPRREANIEMRQTQPGTIQADNPLLLTARLDTAGRIGGHPISPAPHHGPAG